MHFCSPYYVTGLIDVTLVHQTTPSSIIVQMEVPLSLSLTHRLSLSLTKLSMSGKDGVWLRCIAPSHWHSNSDVGYPTTDGGRGAATGMAL